MRRCALLLSQLLLLSSCSITSQAPPPPVHIVIGATADLHGWIEGHTENVKVTGGGTLRSGSLAVLGGYINILREKYGEKFILLDAGDLFQGTLASNLAEGEPVVLGYNTLGYDAVAIGNHEFDYGPLGEKSVADRPGDDPLGALKRNVSIAKFPFLGANIKERSTGRTPSWAKPHLMFERDGVKVGVIGIITPDTPVVTSPANVTSLAFGDPVTAIRASAAELKKDGADAIVVLMHIGGLCSDVTDVHDLSSCQLDAPAFEIARTLAPAEVDLILAGHTHSRVRSIVNEIPIAQAYPLGRGLAVVDLFIDRKAKRVIDEKTDIRPLITVCEEVISGTENCLASRMAGEVTLARRTFEGRVIERDRRVDPVLEPYLTRVREKKKELLAIRVQEPFTRDYVNESTLANLVTDILRTATPGADFAVINSGGLRADLTGPDVTFGNMFEILPFDNFVAILRLTGAEVREMMRLGTLGRQGLLQVSGLKVVLDRSRDANLPLDQRDFVVSLTKSDGTPLDPEKIYTVVSTDFIAAGGDGLMPLVRSVGTERIQVQQDRQLRELVIRNLENASRNGPLVPRREGRIEILK